MSSDQLYTRERVTDILKRVSLIGGVPPSSSYTEKLSTWFRGLAGKGFTSPEFLSDGDCVRRAFTEAYPNVSTRSSYVKAFLKYLSGLTEDEYKSEYPNIERGELVNLLQSIPRNPLSERSKRAASGDEK